MFNQWLIDSSFDLLIVQKYVTSKVTSSEMSCFAWSTVRNPKKWRLVKLTWPLINHPSVGYMPAAVCCTGWTHTHLVWSFCPLETNWGTNSAASGQLRTGRDERPPGQTHTCTTQGSSSPLFIQHVDIRVTEYIILSYSKFKYLYVCVCSMKGLTFTVTFTHKYMHRIHYIYTVYNQYNQY